ncbi:unnamed protein product [Ceutorhynchus assimilis]|uniref:Ig-like domain-containing protein n=1 Tax=Ceutorhynchus assimilis TaxID=467358 RepID=A0A9N9MVD1_9CUCU|nr:unnamed protein product [Ceutorhynchus assimilis]
MVYNLFYFIILGLVNVHITIGKLHLQIIKKTDERLYPVVSNVEENVGTTFSLVCELVSSANESQFDDHLSWIRDERFPGVLSSDANDINEINKSEKKFKSLNVDDRGKYVCVSEKFNLHKPVEVFVRNDIRKEVKSFRETIYCNEHMFQCMSNGICINQHYVCDGKPDCKDGSDESIKKCNGDPCKDKVPCEDGRCIPSAWCCDIHHDPNCTVTNRPTCCQGLSDSYEEMELGFPTISQSHHTARYLFILVCVVSILFSVILLLLIISKVVIFAKKAALQQQQQQQPRVCENIALRNQTNINVIPCGGIYTYRGSRTPRNGNIVRNIIIDSSDVNDPLLFNPSRFNVINASSIYDQPPSYVDVLQNNRLVVEPPPPYRSQEALNLTNENETN